MNNPNPTQKQKDIETTVKKVVSLMLGLEPSDIHDEDFLIDDLHMGPADLTDLGERLSEAGLNVEEIDFQETETLGDLIDLLSSEEEI